MTRRRIKPWVIGALVPLAPIVLLGVYLAWIHVTGNFNPVLAGELYRSAQPTPEQLTAYKSQYGIATIINLRGRNDDQSWYKDEISTARRLGITHVDFRMSARNVLSREKAAKLLSIMKKAKKPILVHCLSGSDRSGLAGALYLAATGHGVEAAEAQLSWKYGHLGIPILSRTHAMDVTFERLEPLLGLPDS